MTDSDNPKIDAARTQADRGRLRVLIALTSVLPFVLFWAWRYHQETLRIEREATPAQEARPNAADAIAQAEQTVRAQPGNVEARVHLARLLVEQGRYDAAAEAARSAFELRPNDTELLLLLADIYNRARKHAEAVATYRAILSVTPNEPRALVGLAYQYLSFGWVSDAITLLEPALKSLPDVPQVAVTLALACMQREDFKRAEQLLLQVRQRHPQDAQLWAPLLQLYNNSRQYDRALAVGQEAVAILPDNVAILTEIGQAQYGLNRLDEALATFQRVLTLQPGHLTALYTTGLCFHRRNRPSEAIPPLEEVYRQNPGYAQVRLFLGKLYVQTGRTAEGRRLLAEARKQEQDAQRLFRTSLRVAQNGQSAEAHYRYALAHREAGNLPRARLEVSRALELDPGHAQARRLLKALQGTPIPCTLGALLLLMKQDLQAMRALDRCIAACPDEQDFLLKAALAHTRMGRNATAQVLAEKAVRRNPEEAAPYLLLARIYGNTAGGAKMKQAIDAYLARARHPAPGYYLLARYHYRRADFARARQAIETALREEPNNPDYLTLKGHIHCQLSSGPS
ncbi:MAG: tetratricopeptide repeat protein, partial [Chthonomonadaceae bacterium]|nr:tetratricopeptide repeat protein [Chthonomonadaceae bacterium]